MMMMMMTTIQVVVVTIRFSIANNHAKTIEKISLRQFEASSVLVVDFYHYYHRLKSI